MTNVLLQRLDNGARLSLPFVTTLVCTFLSVVAWPLPYMDAVAPPLGLMVLYYWAVHRPDLFRPSMAFAIGLLNDVINFLPLGLSALLFVAAHQMILQQRRFFTGHSFYMMWFGFILMIVIVMMAEWIGLCLIRWQGLPFFPVFMQMLLSCVLFPLPCWLLIRLQRNVLSIN